MTYTFKLARRLAILRDFSMIVALALLTACAGGDATSPTELSNGNTTTWRGRDDGPTTVHVSPVRVTIETNQPVRFLAHGRTARGDSIGAAITWLASGGSISQEGLFVSNMPGTFKVVGRGRGRRHTDSSVVIVVPPQPELRSLNIDPEQASLASGATQTFTATGTLSDGSRSSALGLVWTATGGSIDAAGTYSAGQTAGTYRVVVTNTAGTIADTATVTIIAPLPSPSPAPNPTLAQVFVRPAAVTLSTGATKQFRAYGRLTDGDSVAITVSYAATGGTITAGGLYTAGSTAGPYRVIAKSGSLADTADVTLSASLPAPTPTVGMGIPVGLSGLLGAAVDPGAYTMSLDGYTAANILERISLARQKKLRLLMNMTGGSHSNYKTDGVFDMGKWRAKMDTYKTPAIRSAVAAAIADGTIIGNSVMDEPFQSSQDRYSEKSWGPPGTMTKAIVDQMCGYVKGIFPTLPVGVVHDHRDFEPTKSYRVCDFIVSQYRWSKTKGDIAAFRDAGLALARRDGHAIAFSLNVLHGGLPGTTCPKYGHDNAAGTLCPMSPEQVRNWGLVLGSAGCALNMWRYEAEYFNDPAIQRAVRVVADSLARLSRKPCTRSAG